MKLSVSIQPSLIWFGAVFVFAVLIAIIAVPVELTRQINAVRYENLEQAQPATQMAEDLMSAFSNEYSEIEDFQATGVSSYVPRYLQDRARVNDSLARLEPVAWVLGNSVFHSYLKVRDSFGDWHDSVDERKLLDAQLSADSFRQILFSEDATVHAVYESLMSLQNDIRAGVLTRRNRLYEIERLGTVVTVILSLLGTSALAIVAVFARKLQTGLRDAEKGRQEAQQATRARDEILRIVSHDLKNPVNVISMASQQLSRQGLPDHDRRYLQDIIERSTRRIDGLIHALLDVGKIGAGHPLVLDRGEYDMKAIVSESVEFARFAASRKSIHLVCEVGAETANANVDRQRVLQVLSNLIDNAVKFTPEGGKVKVSCTASNEGVRLAVSDTGVGIADADQHKIFDTYWQAKKTSSGGTGIGLAIVKRIVEEHGGQISVKSRLGSGSTFLVFLPRARATESVKKVS